MKYKFLRISLLSALAVLFGGTALGAFLAAEADSGTSLQATEPTWVATGTAPAAGTAIIDNDLVTVETVYATKAGSRGDGNFGDETFKNYIQVRTSGVANADNPTGGQQSDCTPLIVTAKKNVDVTFYFRRQHGTNGLNKDDNKDMLCYAQNDSQFESEEVAWDIDGAYGNAKKTYKFVAGGIYTIYRGGSTLGLFAINVTEGASSEESAESVGTYTMSILPTTIMGEKTQEKLDIQVEVKKIGERYWLESEYFINLTIPFTYNAATKLATFEQTYITTTLDEGFEANPHLWSAVFVFNGSLTDPQPTYAATFDPETGFAFDKEDVGLAWFASDSETTFNPNDAYKAFYVLPAASEDETIYGDPSIEGEWEFTLDWHYAGDYSWGVKTETYKATLDGNTVTFVDQYEDFPIVAKFTAENTLTFQIAAVGAPAKNILTQYPFTDGTNVNDSGTEAEKFEFATFTATYDPETGTLTFPQGSGLLYGYADKETGVVSSYTDAFDFISAKKAGEEEEEDDFADASIEGEWEIAVNDHYAGQWSLGAFTGKFNATLNGNTVTFEDLTDKYNIVAKFTAKNTLTFNVAVVGDPEAKYPLTQKPYTDGSKVSDLNENPEDFVFESFIATYNPEAGTITFPEGSGILYGNANAEGELIQYDAAFDFVSASKAAADVTVTHTWDFTKWSDETVAYLKADAAESAIEGWSDIEKQADAEAGKEGDTYKDSKDNCFWAAEGMQTNENGELVADGSIIKELAGLKFLPTGLDKRNLAIAVNYPTTSLGNYKGGSYLWLGGANKLYFVIPNVKGGTTIKMGVESHKSTDPRGVELYIYDGEKTEGQLLGTDGNAVAAPTVYEEQEWVVPAGEPVDIVVKNTNGCHIYFIDAELAPAASEGDYADASIEGEWEIALNDHYAGQSSLGAFTGKFNATLNGNTVTFEDLTDKYNIVAKFTAKNTLTFNVAIAGNPEAMYPLTQKPYTDGSKVSDLSENPEDFVFESFIATYNPEAGTIIFPEGSGILYGPADTEGVFQYYDAAFDFVSASKAAAEPSYKVVGEYTLPVLSTDITGDKSGEAENVKIEVRNNSENYWIAEVGTTNYFKGQTVPFTYNEETATAQFDASYAGEIEGKHTLFAAFIYKDGNEYIEIQPSVAVGFNPSTGFEWKGYFGFGWFVTDAEFTPTGEIYTAFYVSTTEESNFADASIEGEWKFTVNDHYAGDSSQGEVTYTYTAKLEGNTVTFTNEYDELIVAEFTAENTLIFKLAIVGNPGAMYPLTQNPFVAGPEGTVEYINPEDFTFQSFIATYNPEAGTITFPEGSGLAYGNANSEGIFSFYTIAFDFVSASKAAAEPSYEVVGKYTLPVLSTDITGDKSGEAENVKIEVRNNGENYWIAEVGTTNYFKGQTISFTYNEETATAQFDESYAGEIAGKHTWFAAFIYEDGNENIEIQPSYAVGFNPTTGFEWKGNFGFGWFMTEDAEFTPTNEIYAAFYVSTQDITDGIDAIDANSAKAVYYDLNGRRVESPKAGIYIKKTGNKIQKIVVE